jgi:hypothetical protein
MNNVQFRKKIPKLAWIWEKEWSFVLAITSGLRLGLSFWMAMVWLVVDQQLPRTPEILLNRIGAPTMHSTLIGRMFLDVWRRWDGISLMNIAEHGYQGVPAGHLNYFPLYPLLTRFLGSLLLDEFTLAGLILSTIATGLAFHFMHILLLEIFGDTRLANWTILVWAIYPTSLFLFAPYSDGLFICFAVTSMLALRRRKWMLSGTLASLAGLTRAQGILLGLPIAFVVGQELHANHRPRADMLLSLLVVPVGWLAYVIWRMQYGVPGLLASFNRYSEIAFIDPVTAVVRAFQQAFATGSLLIWGEIISLLGFCAVLGWMLTQERFRQRYDLMIYSLATLTLFLSKHSETASAFQSSTRYVLSLFPVFIGVAALVQKLPAIGRRIYITISLVGLMIVSTLYALFYFVG